MHNFRLLYRLLEPRRRRQLLLVLAAMLAGALAEMVTIGAALSFLVLLSGTGGAGLPEPVRDWIEWFGLDPVVAITAALIAAALASAGLRLLLVWLTNIYMAALGVDMAESMFSRTLRQPYADFVRQNSSEVIAGVNKVQMVVSNMLLPSLEGVTAAVMAIAIAIVLFVIDPVVAGGVGLAAALTYALITFVSRGRLRRYSATVSETYTARTKIIQEGIGGIRDVILDQSQPVFEQQFHQAERRFRRSQVATIFIGAAPRYLVEAAGIVALALVAMTMSRAPGGLIEALPVIGALALGAQRLLPLLQQVYRGVVQAIGGQAMLRDVLALMQQPLAPVVPRTSVPAERAFHRAIEFDRVGFAYADGTFALRDISFAIQCGTCVGIAGPTGGGKSSLLDLLMGLLVPVEGEIRIDGRRLDDSNRSDWQGQLAHVPQSIFLSDDSVAANIAFAVRAEDIDMDRVRAAARASRVADVVEAMPTGYMTRVGERGIRLSGGQRQRIGIARALYKGARVLILDEATSALDDATEASVMESLHALGEDLTMIMVAHRTSTLARCDHILRIEGGRLA